MTLLWVRLYISDPDTSRWQEASSFQDTNSYLMGRWYFKDCLACNTAFIYMMQHDIQLEVSVLESQQLEPVTLSYFIMLAWLKKNLFFTYSSDCICFCS